MCGEAQALPDRGYVCAYRFHAKSGISQLIFESADLRWLHCAAAHRAPGLYAQEARDLQQYDIAGGTLADERTAFALALYLAGAYGLPGRAEADDACIKFLPEKPGIQYCFRTLQAIACLEYAGSAMAEIKNAADGITEAQEEFATDVTIAMAAAALSDESGKDPAAVFSDFVCSKTGALLYDRNSGLWQCGPAYVEELYKEELSQDNAGGKQRPQAPVNQA